MTSAGLRQHPVGIGKMLAGEHLARARGDRRYVTALATLCWSTGAHRSRRRSDAVGARGRWPGPGWPDARATPAPGGGPRAARRRRASVARLGRPTLVHDGAVERWLSTLRMALPWSLHTPDPTATGGSFKLRPISGTALLGRPRPPFGHNRNALRLSVRPPPPPRPRKLAPGGGRHHQRTTNMARRNTPDRHHHVYPRHTYKRPV